MPTLPPSREESPGIDVTTDDDIAEWILKTHTANAHWCCSARMGNSPEDSVVDNHLRVHGTSNLFIADASVFPTIPNGNVHSTVLAMALSFAKKQAAGDVTAPS